MRLSTGLLLATFAVGCSNSGSSFVHLQFTGTMTETVARLESDLSLDGKASTAAWEGPFTLPIDAVLEVRAGQGELSIVTRALAADRRVLAVATTTASLQGGDTQTVLVQFSADSGEPPPSPQPSPEPKPASLDADEATYDFADIQVGTGSFASHHFVVRNPGDVATAPLVTAITAGPVTISSDSCDGQALAAHGECGVDLVFAPSSVGDYSGIVTVSIGDSLTKVQLAYTGAGVATPVAALGSNPSSLAWGTINFDDVSPAPKTTTITNTGTAATGNLTVTILGGTEPFHVATTTCTGTLAPGASCTVTVAFSDAVAVDGSYNRTLKISSGSVMTTVALSGAITHYVGEAK